MRTYKPVRPKASHYARVRYAARLRDQGLSLRQIGAECGTSKDTAMRDLREWDALQAKVSRLPVSELPPGGGNETAGRGGNETATITPLRRTS